MDQEEKKKGVRGPIDWSETIEKTVAHFPRIAKDYKPEEKGDPFAKDAPAVAMLKRIISRLSPVDRNIIILYCELRNTRNVAKVLRVSPRTGMREVARVKALILAEFNKLNSK